MKLSEAAEILNSIPIPATPADRVPYIQALQLAIQCISWRILSKQGFTNPHAVKFLNEDDE